jgi:tetratricopeptide (TPR) repeat protein
MLRVRTADEVFLVPPFLERVLRIVGYPERLARRRLLPALLLAMVLAGLVVAGSAAGLYAYAVYQWRAAEVALSQEQPAEARARLGFCLAIWPRSPDVHLRAARAARLAGDIEGAESHLNRCLQLQNGATEGVQLEFLLLRVQGGEVDELAPVLIDTVEKGHPEAPIILQTLARGYILRLRYKPGYACLSRWIELYPDAVKAYQWRGWVLERLNNHQGATKDYHRALELAPDLFPVRLRVAEMLLEDKQAPEALPHLERLYRQAPNDPHVQARLGMCRFLQGRAEEARQLMEAAVVHLPRDPALLVHLAKLDLQEGRAAEAERWLRVILKTEASDTEALYVMVSALQVQGRSEESAAVLKDYERASALVERINKLLTEVADSNTARADDYAEMGSKLIQIGREQLGEYWLQQALEREPDHQPAHKALADHYEKKGDQEMAATHRRRLHESNGKTDKDKRHSEK